jgi:hypothetical protein
MDLAKCHRIHCGKSETHLSSTETGFDSRVRPSVAGDLKLECNSVTMSVNDPKRTLVVPSVMLAFEQISRAHRRDQSRRRPLPSLGHTHRPIGNAQNRNCTGRCPCGADCSVSTYKV